MILWYVALLTSPNTAFREALTMIAEELADMVEVVGSPSGVFPVFARSLQLVRRKPGVSPSCGSFQGPCRVCTVTDHDLYHSSRCSAFILHTVS